MTTVAWQRSLFGESEAGVGLVPCQALGRRGRGATAVRRIVVKLTERNAVGRSRLTFCYRPLRTWSVATLRDVHELLGRYFARIGGFRTARDATVRAWHDALADGLYTAQELGWAIDATAASLKGETAADTRGKRCFASHPARFIQLAAYWLEQSPEYQARAAQLRASGVGGNAARLAEARAAAIRRELDDIKAGVEDRTSGQADERASVDARRAAFWGSLSNAQRQAALQATARAFRERCEQWGMPPDSPELAPVRVDFAMNWALTKWPPDANVTGDSRADRT